MTASPALSRQTTTGRVKLASTNEDVLRSEVPWHSFQTAGVITKEQLEMLYQLDKQAVGAQLALFKANGVAMAALFTQLLGNVNQDSAVMYTLALLDRLLDGDASIAGFWLELSVASGGRTDPFSPLMKLLGRSSLFIVEKAAVVVARVLAHPPTAEMPAVTASALSLHLSTFAEWVVRALREIAPAQAAETSRTSTLMSAMQALVSSMRGRTAAIEADGLAVLTTLVSAASLGSSAASIQLLYQTLFSLWSLSYSPEAALEISGSKTGLVAKLVDVARVTQKEKVVRVALATLRNLLGSGSASNDMVVFGLMPVLEGMQQRKWADEDIPEDVELLHNTLQVNLQTLSSWDVYKAELDSGKLEWSPSHKSEAFWRDNHKAFEGGSGAPCKQLVGLLQAEDPQVLAVACNDIGQLIKWHPDGRRLMTQHGAKPLAMQVLKHPDPTVQKHALTCVQRLMVINWEYLNRS